MGLGCVINLQEVLGERERKRPSHSPKPTENVVYCFYRRTINKCETEEFHKNVSFLNRRYETQAIVLLILKQPRQASANANL